MHEYDVKAWVSYEKIFMKNEVAWFLYAIEKYET